MALVTCLNVFWSVVGPIYFDLPHLFKFQSAPPYHTQERPWFFTGRLIKCCPSLEPREMTPLRDNICPAIRARCVFIEYRSAIIAKSATGAKTTTAKGRKKKSKHLKLTFSALADNIGYRGPSLCTHFQSLTTQPERLFKTSPLLESRPGGHFRR